jgi:MoaA/NifB/PqqE/SkfB family radical SAM enzyme
MRNVWDEPVGSMDGHTFEGVLEAVRAMPERPTVFFGGLGEPLLHPGLVEMVRALTGAGAPVEVITNGLLLDRGRAEALIDAGLGALWVSIDGASSDCYEGVRPAADLQQVLRNLEALRDTKLARRSRTPMLGICFVAMKRNLRELAEVFKLEYRVGARRFLVTNVYPHTPELLEEILYARSQGRMFAGRSKIRLPRMDAGAETTPVLQAALRGLCGDLEGLDLLWPTDTCPFAARGSTAVRWDGRVSPCLPLLHTHRSYLGRRQRITKAHTVGSLHEHGLLEVWQLPEYVALRRRLEEFDFPPCTACNSCEWADDNQNDCFSNTPPTCGGCLWAQGFIQCP